LRYLKELIRASFKGTFAKNLLTDERKNLNHLLKEEKPYSERRFEFGMLSALQIVWVSAPLSTSTLQCETCF
jgi:hypothetical protein